MVFKRYIRKHGKKLGPYYYENVRSHDGKVKTIYVGTNPHHHPKHKIKRPLFFLILALVLILILGGSLFFLQNKAYLIKKARLQEPNFEIDQILLKVLIRSSEFIEKQVRVMNTGDKPITITIEVLGLSDIVRIDSNSFTIKPGQTKIVTLNFSSFDENQKIEQQPGVYVGKLIVKSEKASKEVPIIVEIETKNVLFDMNLNPVAIERRVKQGSDTTIEVRLFNLQSIESANVDVEYFVKDMNGNTIMTESETVVVKTQASFFKTISVPKNLKPGPYVFAAQAKFGNSIGTASYLFDVVGPEAEANFVQFCKNSILCLGLSLTTILLLFALTAYFYFFIGAYLYEKVTGVVTLPRKRKEKAVTERAEKVAKISVFTKIKNKIGNWKKERERKKAEEERLEREEELQKISEEKLQKFAKLGYEKISPSDELKEFYNILNESKKAIDKKDISKLNKLYVKANELYLGLSNVEKQEVYGKLLELYKQKNQLAKKIEKKEELKKGEERRKEEIKRRYDEQRIKDLEREKLSKERKQKIKEFFHKVGLYKTPEEKKRIALQKEKERQERLRQEEVLRKQKEIEKKKKELEKQRLLEQKRKEEEELKRKGELEEKRKEEERRKKQIEEEKKKQEEQKRQEGIKRQKELEKQKAEEEKERREEELKKQKELEQKRKEEEQRRILEEKRKLEEERKRKEEQEKRQKELEKQEQEQTKTQKLEEIKQIEEKLNKNKSTIDSLNSELRELESEKKLIESGTNETDAKIKKIDDEILNKSKHNKELNLQKESLFENYKKQIEELSKKHENEKNERDSKIKELKAKLAAKQTSLVKDLENDLSKLSPAKRKGTEKWRRLEIKAKLKLEEQNLEEEIKKYGIKETNEKKEIDDNYKKSLKEINEEQNEIKQAIADLQSQKQQVLLEKEHAPKNLLDKGKEIQKRGQKLESIEKENEQLGSELSRLRSELKAGFSFFSNLISGYENIIQKKGIERGEQKTRHGEGKRKQKEFERQRTEEERRKQQDESERKKELKKETPEEKKAKWFESLFNKKKPEIRLKEVKEKFEEKKPEKKSAVKGKKLEKFYKVLHDVKDAIGNNDISKAKEFYIEARNLYVALSYEEKKDAYGELMELYNRLMR